MEKTFLTPEREAEIRTAHNGIVAVMTLMLEGSKYIIEETVLSLNNDYFFPSFPLGNDTFIRIRKPAEGDEVTDQSYLWGIDWNGMRTTRKVPVSSGLDAVEKAKDFANYLLS